jgi:hypothetical protein
MKHKKKAIVKTALEHKLAQIRDDYATLHSVYCAQNKFLLHRVPWLFARKRQTDIRVILSPTWIFMV